MDFDPYIKAYSSQVTSAIPFCKAEHDVFIEIKAHCLLNLVKQTCGPVEDAVALDVGCGIGLIERWLTPHFRQMYGVDITHEGVKEARQNVSNATFLQYDGARLPFPDDTFDVAFAICVLHHVPPPQWRAFTEEMSRVVKKGGLVVIFEHNPFNPMTRIVVSRCEFDRDATLLRPHQSHRLLNAAGLNDIENSFILFFPWRGKLWRLVERFLHRLPVGAQYYVAGVKPA